MDATARSKILLDWFWVWHQRTMPRASRRRRPAARSPLPTRIRTSRPCTPTASTPSTVLVHAMTVCSLRAALLAAVCAPGRCASWSASSIWGRSGQRSFTVSNLGYASSARALRAGQDGKGAGYECGAGADVGGLTPSIVVDVGRRTHPLPLTQPHPPPLTQLPLTVDSLPLAHPSNVNH